MTVDFRCPACQGIVSVLETAAGTVVPCPACAQSIQLPVQQVTSGKAIWAAACGVLSLVFNLCAAVPAVVLCWFAIRDIRRSKGRVRGFDFVTLAFLSVIVGSSLNYVVIARPYMQFSQTLRSLNHLKRLGLAMHNYHDTHKHFPTYASFDSNGQPLLSWRVHLLPFLNEGELHGQFHLDEPWDSPHNRTLIDKMPEVFRSRVSLERGRTCFVAPLSAATSRDSPVPQTLFPQTGSPITFARIPDGTANTIMFVESAANQSVIWTSPTDLSFDFQGPRHGLANRLTPLAMFHSVSGFLAVFADGRVVLVSDEFDDEALRRFFLKDDGGFVEARLDRFLLAPD